MLAAVAPQPKRYKHSENQGQAQQNQQNPVTRKFHRLSTFVSKAGVSLLLAGVGSWVLRSMLL